MSLAERLVLCNRWYDGVSEEWRFQLVVWSLLIVGAINMLLTVAIGFPFALLVVLGILVITAIRLPYVLGWITPPAGEEAADPRFQIEGAGWLVNVNRRYEALPEQRRFWVYPAILLIAGGINMMLTIAYGFPFGLLFLLALLVLVLIRAPFTAGWLPHQAHEQSLVGSEPFEPAIGHDQTAPVVHGEAHPVAHEGRPPNAENPDQRPPHESSPPHEE